MVAISKNLLQRFRGLLFFSQKQCKCWIITLQDEVTLKHIKLLTKHDGT